MKLKSVKLFSFFSLFFLWAPYSLAEGLGGGAGSNGGGSSCSICTLMTNLGYYLVGADVNSTPPSSMTLSTSAPTALVNEWLLVGASPLTTVPYPAVISNETGILPSTFSGYPFYSPITTLASPQQSSASAPGWNTWSLFNSPNPANVAAIPNADQQLYNTTTGNYVYPGDLESNYVFNLNTIVPLDFATTDHTFGTNVSAGSASAPNPFLTSNIVNVWSTIYNSGTTQNSSNNPPTLNYATNYTNGTITINNLFSPSTVQTSLPSMLTSSLLGPLAYSTQTIQNSPYGNSGTQASNAQAFARNFLGMNMDTMLPAYNDITNLLSNLTSTDLPTQNNAITGLFSFISRMQFISAMYSVPAHNVSDMMASRMINPTSGASPAYATYLMVANRFLPDTLPSDASQPATNKWMTSLAGMSDKELMIQMLYLLNEINFQMYQNNQWQEKNNLTLSAQLLTTLDTLRSTVSLSASSTATTYDSSSNSSSSSSSSS